MKGADLRRMLAGWKKKIPIWPQNCAPLGLSFWGKPTLPNLGRCRQQNLWHTVLAAIRGILHAQRVDRVVDRQQRLQRVWFLPRMQTMVAALSASRQVSVDSLV